MIQPHAIFDNFSPKIELPSTSIFCGQSNSGKSTLVFNLLTKPHLFDPPPKKILFFFDQFQNSYVEAQKHLEKLGIELKLISGYPDEPLLEKLEQLPNNEQQIIIIDDFSDQASGDKNIAKLFTNGRHKNLSTWLIFHSLFYKSPESRIICTNTRYFWFLPSLRLRSQLKTFACQLGMTKKLLQAYEDCQNAAELHNRFVLVDSGPRTPDMLRVRTHALSLDKQFVYT